MLKGRRVVCAERTIGQDSGDGVTALADFGTEEMFGNATEISTRQMAAYGPRTNLIRTAGVVRVEIAKKKLTNK